MTAIQLSFYMNALQAILITLTVIFAIVFSATAIVLFFRACFKIRKPFGE